MLIDGSTVRQKVVTFGITVHDVLAEVGSVVLAEVELVKHSLLRRRTVLLPEHLIVSNRKYTTDIKRNSLYCH